MSLSKSDHWVWDSWFAHRGPEHHAFYLQAPRSLGDPDLRHHAATIGHSVSTDLLTWEHLESALLPGEPGSFDDLAVWTGSVVEHDGVWHLFYTGVDAVDRGAVQRIGHATSLDMTAWTRVSESPIVTADPRWYATKQTDPRGEEPFRDPWVFFRPEDGLWHMLLTARIADVGAKGAGTIAHATSPDLDAWTVHQPLVHDSGFDQLEVVQVLNSGGQWVVIFCAAERDVRNPSVAAGTGTYSAPADGPLGPFHIDRAELITDAGIYAGRVLDLDDEDRLALIGFLDSGEPGGFVGITCAPTPVELTSRGTLDATRGH